MPCRFPLSAYYSKTLNRTGKRSLVFDVRQALDDQRIKLPCGQCTACRLDRSRNWAIRCMHEASLHEKNCFITLTYAPKHLPKDEAISKHVHQTFMKDLLYHVNAKNKPDDPWQSIRFYMCAEYGGKRGRPHYHYLLFGYDFPDKTIQRVDKKGFVLYDSELLRKAWPYGRVEIGSVTFESAGYVARYCTKKVTGKHSDQVYLNRETGLIKEAEFNLMSLKPGIGKPWLEKYMTDVFPHDFVLVNGKKVRPPKYYDSLYEKVEPENLELIKENRVSKAKKLSKGMTHKRLEVLEEIDNRKSKLLVRTYENDPQGIHNL